MLDRRRQFGVIGSVRELHRSPEHAGGRFEATAAISYANARPFIADTIRSLRRQEGAPPFELLLVTNATTDGTTEVAMREAAGMPFRVVECESAGYDSNARNVSMREAASGKVLLLDADDAVNARYVSAMCSALDRHALVTAQWVFGGHGDSLPDEATGRVVPLPFEHRGWTYGPAGTIGLRRSLYDAIGGFDHSLAFCANNEWCFRAYAQGERMAAVPDALLLYRRRGTAADTFRQMYRWGASSVAAIKIASAYGLPENKGLRHFAVYWRLAKAATRIRDRRDARDFAGLVGQAVGHVVGSVKHRYFFLG
jgi:glycosyltransferase involved in cell wall biosynthesis